VEVISGAQAGREAEPCLINGHGPYSEDQSLVPLGAAGMPEACADDAPLDGACPTCQTQANLRRWTG
jgi:hypothetical protein